MCRRESKCCLRASSMRFSLRSSRIRSTCLSLSKLPVSVCFTVAANESFASALDVRRHDEIEQTIRSCRSSAELNGRAHKWVQRNAYGRHQYLATGMRTVLEYNSHSLPSTITARG